MIVAIATEENMVAQHFGHCSEYTLFEIVDGRVNEKSDLANPGHEPGLLPRYLAGMGVTYVIAGGMGQRARALFAEKGIDTYVGIEGPVDEVINSFVSGSLQVGTNSCDHPDGGHNCGLKI